MQDETTPLHEACCYGDEKSSNEKCVSLLLDYGADANVHDVVSNRETNIFQYHCKQPECPDCNYRVS